MKVSWRITPAKPRHLAALPEIEHAAASIFPTDVLPIELRGNTTTIAEFDSARQRGLLWVAVEIDDQPVGFAITEDHGGVLHLGELDVLPHYQGKGIGTALVGAVCRFAEQALYQGVSLTTFSNVPWNAPWYEKLGFRVLRKSELSKELKAILLDEARRGLDPESRVAMYMDTGN